MKELKITILIICSFSIQSTNYKTYYAEGASYFDRKDYNTAITNFKKSYQLKPLSQTSYYIALSYNYINNADSCDRYSAIVLKDVNANEQYKTECKKMFDSCEAIIKKNQKLQKEVKTRTVVAHDTK